MNGISIASVGAIVAISYLFGLAVKSFDAIPNKFIPLICGIVGAICGIVGLYVIPDFPASDILNAIAVGIVSGFSATGINQLFKQFTKDDSQKFLDAIEELSNGKDAK